jgi:hypothetical protein
MRNGWLCKCKHTKEDHIIRGMEEDGTMSEAVLSCRHDQAYFKGMCLCWHYRPVSNLEYLENKSVKV